MASIYQKLAIIAAGTALSFSTLNLNPAQAIITTIEDNSSSHSNQTTTVTKNDVFSSKAEILPQQLETERSSNLIALTQSSPSALSSFIKNTSTDVNGFFSVPHNISGYNIRGMTVAVQHTNGNWHTLELSNSVDNRFWWNNTHVQGFIASPNFHNRPVRILLFAQKI